MVRDAFQDIGKLYKEKTGQEMAFSFAASSALAKQLEAGAPAGIFASAEFVERGYGEAYFSVSPTESARSGLPIYTAGGGFKNWGVGAVAMRSLTGDLTGGLQLVGGVVYRRLSGDYADSPITRVGSANQWIGALGLAYSF